MRRTCWYQTREWEIEHGSQVGFIGTATQKDNHNCLPQKNTHKRKFIFANTEANNVNRSIDRSAMSIRWSLLAAFPARSSHCAAVTNAGRLLLYSGECRPRVPIDNALHVLDLDTTLTLRTLGALSHVPEPRVGASALHDDSTNSLYVWGGRGGVDMAPLDRFQAGIWKASLDATDTTTWERLPAVNDNSDAAPALRSFHTSALAGVGFRSNQLST